MTYIPEVRKCIQGTGTLSANCTSSWDNGHVVLRRSGRKTMVLPGSAEAFWVPAWPAFLNDVKAFPEPPVVAWCNSLVGFSGRYQPAEVTTWLMRAVLELWCDRILSLAVSVWFCSQKKGMGRDRTETERDRDRDRQTDRQREGFL